MDAHQNHPLINLSVSLAIDGYKGAHVKVPRRYSADKNVQYRALADTGAQVTCCVMDLVRKPCLSRKDLIGERMSINTASSASMEVLGAVFLMIKSRFASGELFESKQLCYVARGLKELFLSKEACIDMQCMGEKFPVVGGAAVAAGVSEDAS